MLSLRQIFSRQINSLTIAAALVALSSLASRLLGVFRDRILAGSFGAGQELDVYYAAFRVPDLIFNLVVLGALSAGFIPVFSALIKEFKPTRPLENDSAWRLAGNVMNFLLAGLLCLSAFGIIFANPLVKLIAPGFDSQAQAETVRLTRIMFLSPIFLGLSGILGGILQSFKRFLVYSLAPIFYNLGIIVGALYFTKLWGIAGLAWGVVLGAGLHFLIQLPSVYHLGFRYRFILDWRDASSRRIGRMMVPRTMSLAIAQINLVVITVIASGLSSGSLAVFNFANNLQSLPVGLFGISFAIAAFPALSASAFDPARLKENFSSAIRQILFFIIPATVVLIALRAQIIRVVLGTGNFSWQDTILTMNALAYFSFSLFAQATVPLLVRVFYARHDSSAPFYLGLISILANIGLSFWLGPLLGVAGLALAYSASNILNFILLAVWLSLKVGNLDARRITVSVLKFALAALAAGLAAQLAKVPAASLVNMSTFAGVLFQLVLSLAAASLAYALFCYLLRSEEFFGLLAALRARLSFKKAPADDQGEARGV